MTEKEHAKKSYLGHLFSFYFAPPSQSFFTILYLISFSYFAIFHSGKILLALKFLLYTLKNSESILGLGYLFWGVTFLIGLIIPFSVSLYAIFLFFEVWRGKWERNKKILLTVSLIVGVPAIIIVMDDIIRFVGNQAVLREFIILHQLYL